MEAILEGPFYLSPKVLHPLLEGVHLSLEGSYSLLICAFRLLLDLGAPD